MTWIRFNNLRNPCVVKFLNYQYFYENEIWIIRLNLLFLIMLDNPLYTTWNLFLFTDATSQLDFVTSQFFQDVLHFLQFWGILFNDALINASTN